MQSLGNEIPYFDGKSFFEGEDKVYIHLSTDFPDYVGVTHRHAFIEICYVLSGEAIHTVGDREYKVQPGDVTLINSEIPHKLTPFSESGEPFVAYDLMFMPDFLDSLAINTNQFASLQNSFLFYSLFQSDALAQPDLYVTGKRYSDYGELFTRIYHEFKRRERGYIQLMRAYVIELIIKLFRDIERAGRASLSPEQEETVKRAVAFIQENYSASLTVDEIASGVFLGPDHFRKLFKRVTGSSVAAFQQKLRIDEACRLLRTTKEPIKDISAAVGYGDIKAFYQAFKKLTGKTPNEYRNNQ